jgi:hypothetical protein
MISGLKPLTELCRRIFILKGNHDYLDSKLPYFKFLKEFPNIHYMSEPILDFTIGDDYVLFLPHTNNPTEDWKNVNFDYPHDYIFMHQIVSGTKFANDYVIENKKYNTFNKLLKNVKSKIYSGDAHVAQTVGNITYVGSPYSINYGDHWEGEAILLTEKGEEISLPFYNLVKWCINIISIKELKELIVLQGIMKGDRVKVRIELNRCDFHLYKDMAKEVKSILKDLGVDECIVQMKPIKDESNKDVKLDKDKHISHESIIREFAKKEGLTKEDISIGMGLIG